MTFLMGGPIQLLHNVDKCTQHQNTDAELEESAAMVQKLTRFLGESEHHQSSSNCLVKSQGNTDRLNECQDTKLLVA